MMDGRLRRLAVVRHAAMLVAGCATVPPPAVRRRVRVRLVGPDGQAVARAISRARACPAIDVDGVAQPMTCARRRSEIPFAQRKGPGEGVGFSGRRMRIRAARRRAHASRSRAVALPLPKPTRADRRARRHRLPPLCRASIGVPALQRHHAMAVRAASPPRRPRWPRPRHPYRRLPLSREPVSRRARLRGQSLGLRFRRLERRLLRAGASRCSLRRHGSSCGATTRSATARGRAGGASSTRARSRRGRIATTPRTTTSATTARLTPYRSAWATSCSCSIRRTPATCPYQSTASRTGPIGRNSSRRLRGARRRPGRTSSLITRRSRSLRIRAHPNHRTRATPRSRPRWVAVRRHVVPAVGGRRVLRPHPRVRGRDVHDRPATAIRLRLRRHGGRRAAARPFPPQLTPLPAPWSASCATSSASASRRSTASPTVGRSPHTTSQGTPMETCTLAQRQAACKPIAR